MKNSENVLKNLVIPPTTLTFVTTFKCTASCKNCCFACSPNREERLSIEEMKSYVDQAINSCQSIKVLVLTGGETFLIGRDLCEIIEHASLKKLATRIVTNGYWAKTYDFAYKKLEKLRSVGLKELNFSTGDDHQKFVPYQNIVNGIRASMDLGLTTVVNVESSPISSFRSQTLEKEPSLQKYFDDNLGYKKLRILNGVWMPFTKSTKGL